jgi:hypothetical protein
MTNIDVVPISIAWDAKSATAHALTQEIEVSDAPLTVINLSLVPVTEIELT